MQNNDKKYFIPVDGTPIEVSEEIYRAYYQPIWNTRYHAQKNGECRCTKASFGSVTVFAPAARYTLPVRRFPSTRLSAARKTSLTP